MSVYPLEQLKSIKQKRYEAALANVEKKTEALKQEEEKLKLVEKERNEALAYKKAKLKQLREAMDSGASTVKIHEKKEYLKIVDEKLKEKEKKVETQKKEVEKAVKNLEDAKKELFDKKKDLEKLNIHKKEWTKEVLLQETRAEAIVHDELGSARHGIKKQKEKKS